MTETRPRPRAVWLYAIALLGGLLGTAGAMYKAALAGPTLVWVVVLVGPAIEEVFKPIGVIFLLDKRPDWIRRPLEPILMAALGAAVFATLENYMYVAVYAADRSAAFVVYRLVVCTAMHVGASAVFGLGLAKMWRHIRQRGGHFDIDVCFRYYVAAVAIHAAYNALVTVLELSGVMRFE